MDMSTTAPPPFGGADAVGDNNNRDDRNNGGANRLGTVIVVGAESVGKSALIASLTGQTAYSSNFRGSTVRVQSYAASEGTFVDTPGILFASDCESTRVTLEELETSGDHVLVVVAATQLDSQLQWLLPLVTERRGAVAVTFWDKVDPGPSADEALQRLSREAGVPFVPVDARSPTNDDRIAVSKALQANGRFRSSQLVQRAGWQIEPKRGPLEWRFVGTVLALGLLLLPALLAVQFANTFAGWLDPMLTAAIAPVVELVHTTQPVLLAEVFAGRYGLFTMGPLLFVWAAPTVLIYAGLLAVYKASGLIDRITLAIQGLTRPIGLTGRDVVRVIMGMGCNVPAVMNTRSCSSCTRGGCLHAIGFGSACSYQLGATIGVFAAVHQSWLIWPYLGYLTITTMLYSRWVSTPQSRSPLNVLTLENRSFVTWPTVREVWRETRGTVGEFLLQSLPIFLAISLVASLLYGLGVIQQITGALAPAMSLFRLPGEAALPIVMASLRKDGILLFADQSSQTMLSAWQLLTGTYLAGVLLPCLVTVSTIAREQSLSFAAKLVARQFVAALAFSALLAWSTAWL
jgi:ferrous iron transport protein B